MAAAGAVKLDIKDAEGQRQLNEAENLRVVWPEKCCL